MCNQSSTEFSTTGPSPIEQIDAKEIMCATKTTLLRFLNATAKTSVANFQLYSNYLLKKLRKIFFFDLNKQVCDSNLPEPLGPKLTLN